MKNLFKNIFNKNRITRRDIIDPGALKALRELSKEAQKAAYSLFKTQKAMRYVNDTVNNIVWKKVDEDCPEQKGDNSGQSIDVLCLSEKRIKVVSSYNFCERKWNTRLKITHWTYLPKDP